MRFGFNKKYESMLWNYKTQEILADNLDMVTELLSGYLNKDCGGPGPQDRDKERMPLVPVPIKDPKTMRVL